mgnify:CR=1 FL=1
MKTAKVFMSGASQAVRLPKDYRFTDSEVYIKKFQNMIILIPKADPWTQLFSSLDKFSDDFMNDRAQPPQQAREPIA